MASLNLVQLILDYPTDQKLATGVVIRDIILRLRWRSEPRCDAKERPKKTACRLRSA
jgi:hypothetical protein